MQTIGVAEQVDDLPERRVHVVRVGRILQDGRAVDDSTGHVAGGHQPLVVGQAGRGVVLVAIGLVGQIAPLVGQGVDRHKGGIHPLGFQVLADLGDRRLHLLDGDVVDEVVDPTLDDHHPWIATLLNPLLDAVDDGLPGVDHVSRATFGGVEHAIASASQSAGQLHAHLDSEGVAVDHQVVTLEGAGWWRVVVGRNGGTRGA